MGNGVWTVANKMWYLCSAIIALIAVSAVKSNLELENEVSTDVPTELHFLIAKTINTLKKNSVAFSPHANYTDRATAACRPS
jgi:hypothetical protein